MVDYNVQVPLPTPSYWKTTDLLGGSMKRYNAPFTICQAQWNPCIDLIALASEKGEVSTRRRLWKRGWKVNLSGVKPLPHQQSTSDESAKLCSMFWSPGGMYLAVGFSNGIIYMLEREHGHVVYSISLNCTIVKMRWSSLNKGLRIEEDDRIAGLVAEAVSRTKKVEKTSTTESIELLKTFCDQAYSSEILGTLLLVIDDQNIVHVIAAGILPITCIAPPVHLFGNCDPYSVTVGDVYICENSKLLVAYSYVGETAHEGKKEFGYNVQIVTFDIDSFGCFKNESVWRITYRWLRLYYSVCSVSEVFSRMTADWEQQSKNFHKAFEKNVSRNQTLTLAEFFIGYILCGNNEIDVEHYFRELSEADWKKMNDWVGRGFSKLIKSLKNELWTSIELYQHHLKKLFSEVQFAMQRFDNINILPKRIFDVDVYPYGGYDEDEPDSDVFLDSLRKVVLSADQLQFKVAELIEISVRNREKLLNFMRWLSSTTAVKNKGSLLDANVSTKYNMKQLIEFVLEVFIDPEDRKVSGLVQELQRLYKYNGKLQNVSTANNNESDSRLPLNCLKKKKRRLCFDQVIGPMCGVNIFDDYKFTSVEQKVMFFLLGDEAKKDIAVCDSASLAHYVKYSALSLKSIREQVLKIYSSVAKVVQNVRLQCRFPDGFSHINFFMFRVSSLAHMNKGVVLAVPFNSFKHFIEDLEMMEARFGKEPFPALSCISNDGRYHYVCGFSGEMIFKNLFTNDKLILSKDRNWSKMNTRISNVEATVVPSTIQPLSIDTNTADCPGLLECQTLQDKRIIKFESIGDGSYFGLLKVRRDNGEYVHLFRGYFGTETVFVHKEQSSSDSFENIVVSEERKLGIAVLEPQYAFNGSCLRWFELSDSSACIVATKRIVLGEVETTVSMDSMIEVNKNGHDFHKDNDSYGESC
uniref:ANAPC4_WD40 domain-containing protein n=1 Tax=Syphacia muris TaxID=451379 RepID=A0A158R4R2_9BILA